MAERVEVGLIAPAFTFLPLFAAARRGFFERYGIDCRYGFLGSGDAVTEALRGGGVQFAPTTPEGTLAYSFVVSLAIGLAIDATMGLRVDDAAEDEGLDLSQHAEVAYAE